jgi:hypothetical protein
MEPIRSLELLTFIGAGNRLRTDGLTHTKGVLCQSELFQRNLVEWPMLFSMAISAKNDTFLDLFQQPFTTPPNTLTNIEFLRTLINVMKLETGWVFFFTSATSRRALYCPKPIPLISVCPFTFCRLSGHQFFSIALVIFPAICSLIRFALFLVFECHGLSIHKNRIPSGCTSTCA